MSKTKMLLPIFALLLCLGVFIFPVTAFAQTDADTTPPTVTATLSGDTLTVVAKDSGSGVAAIFINEHRFSTLVNGTASVKLKDYAGTEKQVTIYATDTAGNRSSSVLVDNPYYKAPTSTPTPAPSSSTPTPPASSSTPAPSASSTPSASTPPTSTPAPSTSDSSGGATSGEDGADGTESAISEGSTVTTPEGTGQVIEVATDEDGKLFYTIVTPAGNVFYLVIDMARTDGNNVYFLNSVTENDLLALAETDGGTTGGESAIPQPSPQSTPEPVPTEPDPEIEPEPEKKSGGNTGAIIFVVLAVLAAGGAGYYFKILKPKRQAAMQEEEEYEEEEFGEYNEEQNEDYLFAGELDEYDSEGPDDEN